MSIVSESDSWRSGVPHSSAKCDDVPPSLGRFPVEDDVSEVECNRGVEIVCLNNALIGLLVNLDPAGWALALSAADSMCSNQSFIFLKLDISLFLSFYLLIEGICTIDFVLS